MQRPFFMHEQQREIAFDRGCGTAAILSVAWRYIYHYYYYYYYYSVDMYIIVSTLICIYLNIFIIIIHL